MEIALSNAKVCSCEVVEGGNVVDDVAYFVLSPVEDKIEWMGMTGHGRGFLVKDYLVNTKDELKFRELNGVVFRFKPLTLQQFKVLAKSNYYPDSQFNKVESIQEVEQLAGQLESW